MKIALAVVFIGASVVPACAQKKGITKLPKAFGKKPPLTGTAPVVKPVTPRVPPTLQGAAQIPTHFAVPGKALNTVVQREVAKQQAASNTAMNQKVATENYIPQYIPNESELMVALYDIGEANGRYNVFLDLAWIIDIFKRTDETVFLKTGEFAESNVVSTSYEKTWLYIKEQLCKKLQDKERFEIYLSKDSPLKHTFELRQRQLDRFLQHTY